MKSFLILTTALALTPYLAGCSGKALSVGVDGDGGGPPGTSEAGTREGGEGEGGGGGGACLRDTDCGANRICGFPEVDACGAHGQCFAAPQAECAAYSPGCACDGTAVNLVCNGLPTGFAPRPLLHAGACVDSGGGSCATDADCGAGALCGFLESLACAAHGQCFPAPAGPLCNAISPGCACDGTTINIACNGLPTGYSPKALLHAGDCSDGGPGAAPGVCADECRKTYPSWQGNFNNLVLNSCACGGPGTVCTTECQAGFVCGGTASESDACIRCMAGALAPGGKCAADGTFQQQCLAQADCNAFSACIAGCGAH